MHNVHRWYQPANGRYTRPDPIGLEGGANVYRYAEANPATYSDPLGLAVYLCSRKAFVTGATPKGIGNHSYIWDGRPGVPPDERYCGIWSDALEQGPSADACNIVPGSDGREDQVMECCRFIKKNPGPFYFPWVNDCQTGTTRSLSCAGLLKNDPGVPGGRLGPPCDMCSIAPPPPDPASGVRGSGPFR